MILSAPRPKTRTSRSTPRCFPAPQIYELLPLTREQVAELLPASLMIRNAGSPTRTKYR